jgi:hypothetical protein
VDLEDCTRLARSHPSIIEDKIVPPNQAELFADAVRRKGLPLGFLLFEKEQHGFRRAENIKRSLDAELVFTPFCWCAADCASSMQRWGQPFTNDNRAISFPNDAA